MSALDYLLSRSLPLVPKPPVRRIARRYIAGDRLADAARVVRALNGNGFMATLDVLGESVGRRELVERAVREYMEDSSCTGPTLDLYRRLREEGSTNVGVALQAYMRRSLQDVRSLPEGSNVRLCKGIYVEPRAIAYKDRAIVNKNFARLLEEMPDRGFYVGIATHDEELVWEAEAILDRRRLGREAHEFQMLLGVDEQLRGLIRAAGHRLRVYVPFGENWHAYSLRRLKENPRIAGYVALSLLPRRRR